MGAGHARGHAHGAPTITSGMPVLSAHVVVSSDVLNAIGHEKMLHELQGCLGHHFDVEHRTFQLEPNGHAEHEAKLCH
jgi:cobalt-zinc-cadmium efflux system protein